MEMNRKKGTTARVRAHGLGAFEREVDGPEKPGAFCLPPLASLITGGARLMLALAEREVRRYAHASRLRPGGRRPGSASPRERAFATSRVPDAAAA